MILKLCAHALLYKFLLKVCLRCSLGVIVPHGDIYELYSMSWLRDQQYSHSYLVEAAKAGLIFGWLAYDESFASAATLLSIPELAQAAFIPLQCKCTRGLGFRGLEKENVKTSLPLFGDIRNLNQEKLSS